MLIFFNEVRVTREEETWLRNVVLKCDRLYESGTGLGMAALVAEIMDRFGVETSGKFVKALGEYGKLKVVVDVYAGTAMRN